MYMKVCATSLDVQDLRLAYRCVPAWVCGGQGATERTLRERCNRLMVWPPRGCVPTCRVAQLQAFQPEPEAPYSSDPESTPSLMGHWQQPAEHEAAAGAVAQQQQQQEADDGAAPRTPGEGGDDSAAPARERLDSPLAPPEVRQRVISDAAAELLLDELPSDATRVLEERSPTVAVATEGGTGGVTGGDDPMLPVYQAARRQTLLQATRLRQSQSDAPGSLRSLLSGTSSWESPEGEGEAYRATASPGSEDTFEFAGAPDASRAAAATPGMPSADEAAGAPEQQHGRPVGIRMSGARYGVLHARGVCEVLSVSSRVHGCLDFAARYPPCRRSRASVDGAGRAAAQPHVAVPDSRGVRPGRPRKRQCLPRRRRRRRGQQRPSPAVCAHP